MMPNNNAVIPAKAGIQTTKPTT